MKKALSLVGVLSLLALSGCGWPLGAGMVAGGAYLTKPSEGDPAERDAMLPSHDKWCYQTMGREFECYPCAQPLPASRLINVEPENLRPLTPEDYRAAVERCNAMREPVKAEIKPAEVVTAPPTAMKAAPAKPRPKTAKKHKKAVKPKKACDCAATSGTALKQADDKPLTLPGVSSESGATK